MLKTERILILVLLIAFYNCSHVSSKKSHKRVVTDMAGRTMEVPDTIRRVYVNKPGSLLLYAMAPELSICRTLWLNEVSEPYLSSAFKALPYINGSLEEIVKLKPDIIINCFTVNNESKDQANRLAKQTGIPVFQMEIDMEDYSKTFTLLGELLHKEKQAEKMNAFVHRYLDMIKAKALCIPEENRVKVYYAEGEYGMATDPSGSFHSQVIDFVGAENVADVDIMSGKGMSMVSMEQIILWEPDVILCWTGWGNAITTYQFIKSDKVWQSIRAVKNKKVYQIPYTPYGWFDRPPGTNRIIGTIWTAKLLYPELFNYDIKKITKEYFNIFYHVNMTDSLTDKVLSTNPEGLLLTEGQKSTDHLKSKNINN